MNNKALIGGTIGVVLLAGTWLRAADTTLFIAKSGSKMRIEGTSTVHDWQAESPFIAGSLQAGADFPQEPGQTISPGKVNGSAEIFVTVKSLKSVEKDGKPYKDRMDEVMWENLKSDKCSRIIFRTSELVLKEAPKSKDLPYLLEAKGDLLIAGVTNKISMQVKVLPLGDKKLKISGTTDLKMTDYGIKPVELSIGPLSIKTGNDVKLLWDWMVWQKPAPAAAKQ
jgi:hypothetical protein